MAGMSSRFQKAGYLVPKYMLRAGGKSLFTHAVESFERYFATEPFLFIYRDVNDTGEFIQKECTRLGIRKFEMVSLQAPTRGQAETVATALRLAEIPDDTSLTIFNIDTFRPGFRYPAFLSDNSISGYLEVFIGEGDNWSFAKTESAISNRVVETAEKRSISNLCCTGLYYFGRTDAFMSAFRVAEARSPNEWDANELYVAPLYNFLIKSGLDIRVDIVDRSDVIFCGIPAEYDDLLRSLNEREGMQRT
jgi:hypothetical protein